MDARACFINVWSGVGGKINVLCSMDRNDVPYGGNNQDSQHKGILEEVCWCRWCLKTWGLVSSPQTASEMGNNISIDSYLRGLGGGYSASLDILVTSRIDAAKPGWKSWVVFEVYPQ